MITETTGAPLPSSAPARPTRLLNRNYLLLWQGQFVSRVGDQLFEIALVLWMLQLTNSATLMGLLLMLSSVPALLVVPLGGVIADRFSRRWTILLCDFLAGVVVLGLAALAFLAPGQTTLQIAGLFVAAICLGLISSFFGPAISASIPDLVPSERLSSAYAMGQLSQQTSVFLGQGLGGTLFRILGGPLLFFVNGLTFLFSAFSQLFISIPQPPRAPEQQTGWRAQMAAFRGDMGAGFHYIWSRPGLRNLVLATAVSSFFSAPPLLLLPFYVDEHLRVPVDWYGYLLAATGAGSLLGYLLLSLWPLAGRLRMLVMLGAMFVDNALYGLLVLTYNPYVALAISLCSGILSAFVIVTITTMVQLSTPAELRGRVGSLLATISGAVTPIAFGLSGLIADATQRNLPLIYLTCSAVLVLLIVFVAANREIRAFLAYDPAPEVAAPNHAEDDR